MNPFDKAWDAITKFDFFMDPASPQFQGIHVSPQFVQGESAAQFTAPDSRNTMYSDRANENRFQQANEALYGPQQGPAYQPPVADMSNTAHYRTGASEPRLNDDGSFTGVNLSGLYHGKGDFTDGSKWNENVQNLAAVGAHETVHNLIDEEIDPWAREESGYGKSEPPPVSSEATTPTPTSIRELFARMEAKENDPAKKNYEALRSLGHEFGAFSSTPDSSQPSGFMSPDMRTASMSNPSYGHIAPYMSGDKPFSELRSTQKSEPFDQAWGLLNEESDYS